MKFKPLTLALTLGTLVLASLFTVRITISEFPPDPEGAYSPWADLNDDGEIDIFDVVWLATRYGETGTPVNKTALLYSINDTFTELLAMIDALNSTVIQQQTIINGLNKTVVNLNETVNILNSTGLGLPDFDSGWRSWDQGSYLTHNLNTTDLLVYFLGSYDSGGYKVTHQYSFGSQWDPRYGEAEHGAWWAATSTTIILYRGLHDFTTSFQPWDYVRIMIWKVPQS